MLRAMGEKVEEVYRGKVLHLFVHRVMLPNGHEATLEIIRHPGAAAVVPFLPGGDVLMVRQYRHATGGYLLEVPAGKLDPGESPETCAMRETEEEVGHRPGRLERLGSIHTTPGFTDEVIHLFSGHDLTPTRTSHERDEVLSVVRMPFAEALQAVERGEITDAKSVSALLLAARRRSAT
jgi:ADP-ribose pyrophosphatase